MNQLNERDVTLIMIILKWFDSKESNVVFVNYVLYFSV